MTITVLVAEMEKKPVQNFVNNEFITSSSFLDSYDPSVGEVWVQIPDSTAEEVEMAYQAAKKAFPG